MRQAVVLGLGLGLVVLGACGGPEREGDDAPGGPCTGNETRCVNNAYQECENEEFVTVEVCTDACSVTLGGCAECDPGSGNTCDGTNVAACNSDGTIGGIVEMCDAGNECQAGQCARACTADGVDLIYVVDEQYRLLSFDPRQVGTGAEFQLIGALNCPHNGQNVPGWLGTGVTPFSMSVDRTATAWVLYTSGEIFKVSTQNASCAPTGYTATQANMLLFGMGFVTDVAGGETERLFIGGGDPDAENQANRRLGSVDPASYALTMHGNMTTVSQYSPELTGTGNAELFGFYPGVTQAFVEQVDKTTGAGTGTRLNIPNGLGGTVTAWAFAQWGGSFWIFVTTTPDGINEVNTVRLLNRMTGQYSIPLQNTQYKVVGAGVSTCAPVTVE